MYSELADFLSRPAPFSRMTIRDLWTDPHIARQMLGFHLDESHDLASRRGSTIDAFTGWLAAKLGLSGRDVLDLGCGPGLYAERLARLGARVTGLDFSAVSLGHARQAASRAGLAIDYVAGDYLADNLPGPVDAALLIYGDYCAMAPAQRRRLLANVKAVLKPGGVFAFDVFSPGQFAALREGVTGERAEDGGFWMAGPHVSLRHTLRWEAERVSLERYFIAGPERQFEIFNWMQYYTPETISAEVAAAGFSAEGPFALDGADWPGDDTAFVMLARP